MAVLPKLPERVARGVKARVLRVALLKHNEDERLNITDVNNGIVEQQIWTPKGTH